MTVINARPVCPDQTRADSSLRRSEIPEDGQISDARFVVARAEVIDT